MGIEHSRILVPYPHHGYLSFSMFLVCGGRWSGCLQHLTHKRSIKIHISVSQHLSGAPSAATVFPDLRHGQQDPSL